MGITRKQIPDNFNVEKFLSLIVVNGECWNWIGTKQARYGVFHIDKKQYKAHRVSFKIFIRDPKLDMAIDHICRNRSCVNPDHLREVTDYVNYHENSVAFGVFNKKKTHCKHGHEFTQENTRVVCVGLNGGVKRHCRECDKYKNRKKNAKHTVD